MKTMSEIRKLSCYAVLRAGYTGDNYLYAHMRLVLLLIYNKKYTVISVQELVRDFKTEYHYAIDYFPMVRILSLAVQYGYLTKNHNSKKYNYTKKISDFSSVKDDIESMEQLYAQLINEFIVFCRKKGVEYSYEEADKIVSTYIDNQKLEHFSGHIENFVKDKRVDYLFGSFLYLLPKENIVLFDYVNSMVTGAILVDCLVFCERLENGKQLDNLTVVLDTTPVFIALGIDIAGRESYYNDLLKGLKDKGAKLAMFEHSYNEMQFILSGTKEWVDNYNYDPAKASATTEYFKSIDATKDDVEEFSLTLREKIKGLGIEIINIDYTPQMYPHQIDEEEINKMIVEHYEQTNPLFDQAAQQSTIDLDVKSIAYLYFLRAYERPVHIADAKYIFVTANNSIAKIAADYNEQFYGQANLLPTTLTDIFIGTYIWLSDPMQITKMNAQQIMAQAYLAFQPSSEMLEKLSKTVTQLLNSKTIDSDLCYAIRGSKLVSERIMQKTLGDPEAFTDSTPLDIINEIREEGAALERNKNRIEAENKQKEMMEKISEITKNYKMRELEKNGELKKELLKSLQNDRKQYNDQLELKNKAKKTRGRWEKAFVAIAVLLCILLVVGIVSFAFLGEKDWYSPIVALICTTIPIISVLIILLIWFRTGKKLALTDILSNLLENIEKRKLRNIGFSEIEFKKLENDIEDTKQRIKELEEQK